MAPSCRHESDTALYYQTLDIRLLGRGWRWMDIKPQSVCMCVGRIQGGRECMWSSLSKNREWWWGWGAAPCMMYRIANCVVAAIASKNKGVFMSSLTDLAFINVLPPSLPHYHQPPRIAPLPPLF